MARNRCKARSTSLTCNFSGGGRPLVEAAYRPIEEKLTVNWVKSEYHQGNYPKGEYMIKGTTQKGFQVNATRELLKAD